MLGPSTGAPSGRGTAGHRRPHGDDAAHHTPFLPSGRPIVAIQRALPGLAGIAAGPSRHRAFEGVDGEAADPNPHGPPLTRMDRAMATLDLEPADAGLPRESLTSPPPSPAALLPESPESPSSAEPSASPRPSPAASPPELSVSPSPPEPPASPRPSPPPAELPLSELEFTGCKAVRMTLKKSQRISVNYDTIDDSLGLRLVSACKPYGPHFQLRKPVERAERRPSKVKVAALGQRAPCRCSPNCVGAGKDPGAAPDRARSRNMMRDCRAPLCGSSPGGFRDKHAPIRLSLTRQSRLAVPPRAPIPGQNRRALKLLWFDPHPGANERVVLPVQSRSLAGPTTLQRLAGRSPEIDHRLAACARRRIG